MTVIEKKLSKLNPKLQREAEEYIDMLLSRQEHATSAKLNPRWKGILKNVTYTSVELQHKALEWWSD